MRRGQKSAMCTSTILGPRFPHKVGHSEVFLSLKQVGHARTVSTSTYVQFSISSPPLSTQPVLIMGRTTPKERLWAQKQALKGESIHHVADVLRTSVKSLQKYWPTHGKRAPPVDDKPRPGRPRKLPGPIITSMKKKSKRRVTASQLARDYMGPHGQTVSRQTVARALATGSRPLSYQRITKIKRLSRVNKQKRYEFCQQFKPASKLPWVFIDGTVCTLYENGGTRLHGGQLMKCPGSSRGSYWHTFTSMQQWGRASGPSFTLWLQLLQSGQGFQRARRHSSTRTTSSCGRL